MDIAVVDYGMGNLRSVAKALEHVAPQLKIAVTDDPDAVRRAARVVFPGQGAMPDCMREMDARGLRPAVLDAARRKPFLGICIGLQMLFERSEEGDTAGLAILRGRVRRFANALVDAGGARLKVPHMGWNQVWQTLPHALWNGIEDGSRFYFVHSYYVDPADSASIAGASDYPGRFACAIMHDNIFAVQFHPEKSDRSGLQLLANFANWQPVTALGDNRQAQAVERSALRVV